MDKQTSYLRQVRSRYPDLEAGAVRFIDEGEFNDILIVNGSLVFRFPRSLDGVERLRVEAAVLRGIQEQVSVPIPNPVFVSEDMQTVGATFVGYRILPGEPLKGHVEALKANSSCRQKLANQLATFLRELHSCSVEAIELDLPTHDQSRRGALPRSYQAFRDHLFPYMRLDARDMVRNQFDAFLSDPGGPDYERVLKHGDLGPGNILLDPETLRISGIIDFGSAGLDDPAIDLGFISLWGESLLGEPFVERLYGGYLMTESLLTRARFFKTMIALTVALGGLQSDDREAFEFGLAQYM